MIAEGMVKQRFVDKILGEESEIIKKLQLAIVHDWNLMDNLGETTWNILRDQAHSGLHQICPLR